MEEYKSRRSLYIVEEIKEGEIFTEKNVKSIRPNNGLSPKFLHSIIGKKASRNLMAGIPLEWDMIIKESKV